MASLPSGTLYGTVVGQFIQAVADGADADRLPDVIPVRGTVTFAPSAKRVVIPNATPNPLTVFQQSIVATLDSEGYLIGPDGTRGIVLIASDSPGNPTGFTYTVTLNLEGVSGFSFSFFLVAGSTVDLSTVIPVAPDSGALVPTDVVMETIAKDPNSKFAMFWQSKIYQTRSEIMEALNASAALALNKSANLSDLVDFAQARTNLNVYSKGEAATAAQGVKADAALPADQKGAASGVATLDSGGALPESQLPSRLGESSLASRYYAFLPSPGNSVDISSTIQSLYDSGTRIIDLQPGAVYLFDGVVFLDTNNVRAILTINFNGAIVNVGPNAGRPCTPYSGTAGTKFLFYVNNKRTTAATVPVSESTSATGSYTATVGAGLVVNGGDWRGTNQPEGRLVRVAMANNTSFKHYGGRISYLAGLYATAGYTDSCTVFDFRMTNPTSLDPNPSIAYQQSNGDAFVMIAPNSDAKGMVADMRYTRGGALIGAVGGSIKFVECRDMSVISAHIEGDEGTRQQPPLRLTRTLASVRDSEFWVPTTAKSFAAVEIADGTLNQDTPTELTMENVTFVNVYRGNSVADEQSMPEINILSMNLGSTIRARNVWSAAILVSTTDYWRRGVRVVSSDSAIQTALTSGAAQIATGNWELKRFNNAWRVSPLDSELVQVIGQVTAPTVDSVASTDQVVGTLAAGDYTYQFAMIDGNNVYGNSAGGTTATLASPRNAMRLIVSPRRPGRLVVWRTGPGQSTPDRYAIIGVASAKIFLYDTGENINKRAWVTTGIPSVPATSGSASVDSLKFNNKAVTVAP